MMEANIIKQMQQWQAAGERVVLVTGVFDVLHIEHLRFLRKAKAAGDRLIVGIEADARVKAIKGYERPLNDQTIRLEQLEAITYVDMAFILPEAFNTKAEWETFMKTLHPNVYAVSSHTSHLENKRDISKAYGITFQVVHEFNPVFSSTRLIDKIKRRD